MATKDSPLTYHESYGDVTRAQLAAYRKFNVSPSDHDTLVEAFGEDDHAAITTFVKEHSPENNFRVFDLYDATR